MGGSKSAKGGPNPLADMDRGVQVRCDTGIRDQSPGIWNHNAWDWDHQYFLWNQGSGKAQTRVQG